MWNTQTAKPWDFFLKETPLDDYDLCYSSTKSYWDKQVNGAAGWWRMFVIRKDVGLNTTLPESACMHCWRLHSLNSYPGALDCSLYYAFAFISFDILEKIPKMSETCLCMSQPSQDRWNMTDTHPHKKEAFSMSVFTYMSSHCFISSNGFFLLRFFTDQELF